MNKKIRGAKSKTFNGINFKSLLEVGIYKILLQEGFNPKYEEQKFIIWEGFRPNVPFYNKNKKNNNLKLDMGKLRDITYTPDFTFYYKNKLIIIEAKGFENDVFPIKKKMFRKLLEEWRQTKLVDSIYFEIFNKSQILQAVEIINKL